MTFERGTFWFLVMTWRCMVINAFLLAVGLVDDPVVQRWLLVATAIVVGAIMPFPTPVQPTKPEDAR